MYMQIGKSWRAGARRRMLDYASGKLNSANVYFACVLPFHLSIVKRTWIEDVYFTLYLWMHWTRVGSLHKNLTPSHTHLMNRCWSWFMLVKVRCDYISHIPPSTTAIRTTHTARWLSGLAGWLAGIWHALMSNAWLWTWKHACTWTRTGHSVD